MTNAMENTNLESYVNSFLNETIGNVDINSLPELKPLITLPGDDVTEYVTRMGQKIKIGKGLIQTSELVVRSNKAGILRHRPPTSFWVETKKFQYTPQVGDQILGIIEDRGSEWYRVNICAGSTALLNRLGFEGATKRNKPELRVGDVIYCRVLTANQDIEPEVTCISSSAIKKEWSSGETVYGALTDGLLIRISMGLAKQLLLPDNKLLHALGRYLAFEVAIGVNCMVWLSSASALHSILIRNAILNAQTLSDEEQVAMVDHLIAVSSTRKK